MNINPTVGIIIRLLNGRILFLSKGEYSEKDNCFEAKSKDIAEIMFQSTGDSSKTLNLGVLFLNNLPYNPKNIKILKTAITTIETIDSESIVYKAVLQQRSGLVFPK